MELGIIIWTVSACACATWMSTYATSRDMPEFRWYMAGLIANVLALPFFFWALHRASLFQAAALADEDGDELIDNETGLRDSCTNDIATSGSLIRKAA